MFDDEAWAQIVEHWRIAARLANQGGLKGILFDPEAYTEPHRQFAYTSQAGWREHTFAEYAAKARERGREIMQAVAGEYPDITIFWVCFIQKLRPNHHPFSPMSRAITASSASRSLSTLMMYWGLTGESDASASRSS